MYQCELRHCDGRSYESRMEVCENMLPNSGGVTSNSMWKFTDVAEERHGTVRGVKLPQQIGWDMMLPVGHLFPPFRRDEAESWLPQHV